MPVLKPRNRVVVFRLTQDEYQNLKTVCVVRGARNISDFARSELLTSIEQDGRQDSALSGRLTEVGEKLSNLESAVERVTQLLEGIAGRK